MSTLAAAADAWNCAGATVLAVANDGTKAPRPKAWGGYRERGTTTADTLTFIEQHDSDGIGVLTGAPSGNLELFELEAAAVNDGLLDALAAAMTDHGFGDLWSRVSGGYSEMSGGQGLHYFYRVAGEARGNTKLARRPATTVELAAEPSNKIITLVETRGDGGFAIVAPSAGRTHLTGGAWIVLCGSPATIPTITPEERDALYAIATTLDRMPINEPEPATPSDVLAAVGATTAGSGVRPGDDYNNKTTWEDILIPRGWTKAMRMGTGHAWTRPGKKATDGISATTGQADDADRLYVFSSSTEFDTEKPYTKFAAYALLEHGGDYTAAAKKLARDGYGEQRPRLAIAPSPNTEPPAATARQSIDTDGSSARVIELEQPITARTYGPTEDGVARALAHLHSEDLRYCPQRGQWLIWTGSQWAWDDNDKHREFIKDLTRVLPEADGWLTFKKRALSAAGVTGIARQARSDQRLAVNITDLDAQPFELNTPTGIVDLRTGQLAPSDPGKLHTRTTAVAPDFDSDAPVFAKFLADTFGESPQLRGFVQRVLGLSLVGRVLEQILIIAHGPGANGKSTLFEAAMHAIGKGVSGYAGTLPTSTLLAQRYEPHPTDIARLAGQRLTVASEIEDGQRFHEEKIKKLTGGDTISARFMRQDTFDFTPTHTLFLLANHLPSASAGGPAFWRRVVTVPFNHVVPVERRDPRLLEKLEAEAPTILAWIIKGAAAYFDRGLDIPDDVRQATEAYERDQDTVTRFIEEQCSIVPREQGSALTSALRERYESWCFTSGETPVNAKQLTQQLREKHNVHDGKGSKGRRRYEGILLRSFDDETEE